MEYSESGVQFDFDDSQWQFITQFDSEKDYEKVKNALEETKAVDFVGMKDDRTYFFEIKGFRGYATQSSVKKRLANGAEDLTTEIAQKVRDTLSCLLGAVRNSTNSAASWKLLCKAISDNTKPLLIIAWIEEDTPNKTAVLRNKAKNQTRRDKLKTKLSWLSNQVLIMNVKEYDNNIEGLSVKLLAR